MFHRVACLSLSFTTSFASFPDCLCTFPAVLDCFKDLIIPLHHLPVSRNVLLHFKCLASFMVCLDTSCTFRTVLKRQFMTTEGLVFHYQCCFILLCAYKPYQIIPYFIS